MSILVANLLSSRAKKFGSSEQSQDFQQIFLDAVNYALDDIDRTLGLTTDRVVGTNDAIDLNQQLYEAALMMGIDYYIADFGAWTVQNLEGIERKYKRKLDLLHMTYAKTIDLSAKFGDLSD